ncbi:BgTH12-01217 [Blumeria graminis f. sp. triticale]|uniref:BgTH12-01217 n=1 Tax=Blumeria graminis f. sp. triticale TaxID=1689686 RepID=A0A9W4GJA9_BLUGR|nr:BgTH12-01217 [Blumeria graminis f. sp. triticale]
MHHVNMHERQSDLCPTLSIAKNERASPHHSVRIGAHISTNLEAHDYCPLTALSFPFISVMLTSRLPTEASAPPVLYVPASHALFHAQYPAITPAALEALRTRCAAARSRAYCRYSHFRVGATLLSAAGNYFDGANIENASFPLGICAERVALYTAVFATRGSDGNGPARFIALALAADCETPVSPCGLCRQSLDMPILMFNKDGHFMVQSLEQLLPFSFGPEALDPRSASRAGESSHI